MALTITDRIDRHRQLKARLAEKETKIKADERKARTRRLIEAGGLLEKTGLIELDTNALYGALLSLRDAASDKAQCEKWAIVGGRAFDREAKAKARESVGFILKFPDALPKEATTVLRASGFRFNKFLRHWEGLATPDVAKATAERFGGTASAIEATAA